MPEDEASLTPEERARRDKEREERRRTEVMGGGLFNSQWIAAIDNTGEAVVLHHRDHV